MHRFYRVWRFAAVLSAGVLAACGGGDNNRVLGPQLTGTRDIFQSYVALGNSITAGYQSGGLNDSLQRRSYASLLAAQMGTRYVYPQLAGRGCAPPVNNFQTQARQGPGSTSSTCDLRTATTANDILNNVAVPGATVADLTAESGTTASNTLTSLFLGGKTQVKKALDANPTFASIWIGNNDVLAPAVAGVLVPMAGVSPGVTPQATFETELNEALTGLGAENRKGVLVGVANVSNIPVFFPAAALLPANRNANAFFAGFEAATGRVASGTPSQSQSLTVDNNCTGSNALVSFRMATQIARYRANPSDPAGHPPHIACGTNTVGLPAVVGELFILTGTEQTALAAAVTAYNTFISGRATALGWAYVNPNVALDSVKAAGGVPVVPNLASATATFGAWFSLDGAHPSNQAHRLFTNHLIDAINAKYSTSLVRISVP